MWTDFFLELYLNFEQTGEHVGSSVYFLFRKATLRNTQMYKDSQSVADASHLP